MNFQNRDQKVATAFPSRVRIPAETGRAGGSYRIYTGGLDFGLMSSYRHARTCSTAVRFSHWAKPSGGFGRAQRLLSPRFPPCLNAPPPSCPDLFRVSTPTASAARPHVDGGRSGRRAPKPSWVPVNDRWYYTSVFGGFATHAPTVAPDPDPGPSLDPGGSPGSGSGVTKGESAVMQMRTERDTAGPAGAPDTRRNEMYACGKRAGPGSAIAPAGAAGHCIRAAIRNRQAAIPPVIPPARTP